MSEALTIFFDRFGLFLRVYLVILLPGVLLNLLSLALRENVGLSIVAFCVSFIMSLLGGIYLLSLASRLGGSSDLARTLSVGLVSFGQILSDGKKIFFAPLLPLLVFLIAFLCVLCVFFLIVIRLTPELSSGLGAGTIMTYAASIAHVPMIFLWTGGVLSVIIAMLSYYAMYFSIFYALQKPQRTRESIGHTMSTGYQLSLRYWWVLLGVFLLLSIIGSIVQGMLSLLDVAFRWRDIAEAGSTLGLSSDIASWARIQDIFDQLSTLSKEDIIAKVGAITQQHVSSILIKILKDIVDLSLLSITFLVYAELVKKYLQKLTAQA